VWECAKLLCYTMRVTMELNDNKNRRAKFNALSVDYDIIISSHSLHIIDYI